MLNKIIYCGFFASFLSLNIAHSAEIKIAVVDMQIVERKSVAVANVATEVQEAKDKMQNELSQKEKALQKEAGDLQNRSSLLSQEVLKQKKDSLQRKFADFQSDFQNVSDSLEKIKVCSFSEVEGEMKKAIKIAADRGKYDLIIPSNALLYSGNNIADITDEIIKELNARSKSIDTSMCFDSGKSKK